MPAKSASQARVFRAAAHGASFAKAKQIRATMTPEQIRDFEHQSGGRKTGNRYKAMMKK